MCNVYQKNIDSLPKYDKMKFAQWLKNQNVAWGAISAPSPPPGISLNSIYWAKAELEFPEVDADAVKNWIWERIPV